MQILEIVLYSKNGKRRVIPLKLNQVNIILGESGTGKSVLSNIVEYCMGTNQCNIAEGIIREKVSWFGIKVQLSSDQAFIARENPGYGKLSTNQSYIEIGDEIESRISAPNISNITSDAIVEYLSSKIGITANKSEPTKNQTRQPLEANIKHTFYYLFQEQDEIATNKFLFHRQTEKMMPEAIQDTLPYFLGIIPDDRLALLNKLFEISRELKKALKEFDDAERIKEKTSSKILELISEACEVCLIEKPKPEEDPIIILKSVLNWKSPEISLNIIPEDRLSSLQNEFVKLKNNIRVISDEIDQAKIFSNDAKLYSSEVDEQVFRLQSIGLFGEIGSEIDTCPMCAKKLDNPLPSTQMIKDSINKLSKGLENTTRERPKLNNYIEQKTNERKKLQRTADEIIVEINGIYNVNDSALQYQDLNIRRGRVIGRVSSYFDSVKITEEDATLKNKIAELSEVQKKLEEQLDSQEIEENLNHSLGVISYDMTMYAQQLHLEHSNNLVKLDLKKVTVVVDRDDKPITLKQMGSAANFLGYHLVTLFALHKFFRKHNRPVPQFLFLDQISQVYFPKDLHINDLDRTLTKKLFEFIFKFSHEILPNFQIILYEHAEFPEKWYQDSIVQRFDSENALIPHDW